MRITALHRLFLAAVLAAGAASAQSTFGNILGSVTDSSGAVIPNVKVTVTSIEENVARPAVADEQGTYQALNLKAGSYTVTVEAPGFKVAKKAGLLLVARQTLRADFTMEVGQVSEQVTVEAGAAVVSTETQTISTSFDSKQVLGLPTNFRGAGSTSPLRVLAFLPGVQADNNGNLSAQGALPNQSEVSLDGISTVSPRSNGPLSELFPSVEGIAEMKMQAVGNAAEYGQVGDITTTSKGGSNSYHGSLFEYMQNRAFDATAFGSVTKPQKTANTFGGAIGGRIFRNKTFFFGDFERMNFRRGQTIQNAVPTAAMRQGNFINESGTVRDPFTGQPYPNSRIPASQITSQATKILDYYPQFNFGPGVSLQSANYRNNVATPITSWQYDVRVDHVISSKQQIFGRWSNKDQSAVVANNLLIPSDNATNFSKSFVVSHNYAFTPRLLNEFRAGITHSDVVRVYNFDGRAITAGFGFQGLGPFPYNGITGVTFSNATTNFGKAKAPFTENRNFQFNDNLTWIKGKHTMKFGFDVRRLRAASEINFFGEDDYGRFSFDGRYTGNDFADFLVGIPFVSRLAKTAFDTNGLSWHYSMYAQDSFKVSQKLTLELGLRWEYHPPFADAAFNITNFDRSVPVTGRVIIPTDPDATKITAPGFRLNINACPAPAVQGIPCTPMLTAKEAGYPEQLRFPDKNDYSPRFGFAYRPFKDNRTVVRGGFGVYTMTILGNVFYSLTGIHASDIRDFNNTLTGGTPGFRWPQTSTGGTGVGTPVYGGAYFGTAVQPTFRDPYMMQYNFTVERDLGWSTGLRVSYIGNRSVNLPWAPDLNQPSVSTTPYANRPLTDRPFPYWGRINSRDSGASGLYSSMQTELVHRYSNGLVFNTAWTWAKNLSDAAGNSNGFSNEVGGGRNANSLDRRADRGNVGPTRRHRWITSAMYEIPIGRGKRYLGSANSIVNGIAGGWRISGILLAQGGPYLTPIFTGGDPSGTNGAVRGNQRPDLVGDPVLASPTADVWWNRSAFICPGRVAGAANQFACNVTPIGRFGNAGSGTLLGPGTINLNFGFGKDFRVTERAVVKFEGSFTNLPNHPNLDDPGTNITSVAFGRTTSARGADSGGNRIGMFALRLEF
ncbi:MAG: TonB-dependent receptor [Acidobacteriia bacterium]|nr:TonB-dependent receptor [Terriglobia bacterium]